MEIVLKKININKSIFYFIVIILFLCFFSGSGYSGENNDDSKLVNTFKKIFKVEELNFENQDLNDIFQTIASISGVTIVVSDDIKYFKSYHFRNITNLDIFKIILKDNNLTFKIVNSIIYVQKSRNIYISVKNDLIDMEINNGSLIDSLYELFVKLKKVIIMKGVNDIKIDLNIKSYTLNEIIDLMSTQYNLEFNKIKNGYIIKDKKSNIQKREIKKSIKLPDGLKIEKKSGVYYIYIKNVSITDFLEQLFNYEGKDYNLLLNKKIIINNLTINGKDLKYILDILKNNYYIDYINNNEFYTIYSSSIKKSIYTEKIILTYVLKNITIEKLKNVLPEEISLFKGLKYDEKTSRVYVYGFYNEVVTILNLLKSIDSNFKKYLKYYHLNYIKIEDFKKIIPQKYKNLEIMYIPEYNSFVVNIPEDLEKKFTEYIKLIDKKQKIYNIKLNYIDIESFKNKLPENYRKYVISENKKNNVIVLKAPLKELVKILKYKNIIDIPEIMIKDHILIIQTRNGFEENFLPEYNVDLSIFDSNLFDIVKKFIDSPSYERFLPFGKYFSIKLNWAISSNYAKISADSIIYALNNTEVEFNNSSTFRYKEKKYDEENNKWVDAGVIREIAIGFFLNLKGYYNENNEIVLNLSGKVSRVTNIGMIQTDSSVLPMTSEKIIKNEFKVKDNTPILAASFKEETTDVSISKVPILSDIPIIGKLFTKKVNKTETVNFYIYILPQVIKINMEDNIINSIFNEIENK